MDFTILDNLISVVEKKSPRPGSPPEVVNGHLGVWRTIRHNRMFIELKGRSGNESDLGRVLIGPPSFVGHKLNEVDGDAWEALTPRATLKEFNNISVADNGIDTLKQSIRNAVGPNDTRREALDSLNSAMQLVPIARSAGFKDEEIKQALGGNSPNKPLSEKGEAPSANPRLPKPKTEETEEAPKDELAERRRARGEEVPERPEPPKPEKPEGSQMQRAVGDNTFLETAVRALSEPAKGEEDREKTLGKFLDKISDKLEDDLLKKQVKKIAAGLQSGDYNINDVKDKLQEISRNKEAAKANTPKPEQIEAMQDRAEIKEFINTFDDRLEEKIASLRASHATQDLPASQVDSMQIQALQSMLQELLSEVKSPQAKQEIKHIMESVRVNPFSKRSVFLRLYQILQVLMLLVPVL